MKEFREKYSRNDYSQNGEDGIIEECIKRIDLKNGVAVEFGAPTKKYCSNIYSIYKRKFFYDKNDAWVFHWLDCDPQDTGIDKVTITPENVNELPKCDVLSIDIDGNDYEVWKAYKGKPAIVIIEINSGLDPEKDFFDSNEGCNFSKMIKLGWSKDYFLLCHTGNMVFVDRKYLDLFPENKYTDGIELFDRAWLQA